jgi:lipopolysaccharide heptosyltransferase II
MGKQFRNILIRATNWVGDAVMSAPALQALRAACPQARIAILARPWVAGLYARQSFCDELISYELPHGWKGLQAKRKFAVALRSRKFDCAVLLQNAFEAAALTRWARIPVRIGYSRDARGWLLTHPIDVPSAGELPPHQRFYYLEMLKRAGLIQQYSTDQPIRLEGAAAAAIEGRAQLLAQLGSVVIGVNPGSAFGGAKRWPAAHFAAAAVRLARARAAAVAVFGSQEDRQVCAAVCAAIQAASVPCVSFAGTTTISQYCEMAAACQLVLTNDSGAMHVASALGVPTVAVFGATDDRFTGPTGERSRVVREHVHCSPCHLRECPIDHRCMTRVSAERVAEIALALMDG